MGTRTASVTVITVALPLLLLALTATPAVGKDSEALLWANNFYTKLIEPLKKAADLDGIEKRFKDNNYKLKMPDGTAFTAQLGGFLEDVAAKVIRSTARIAEYVRENRPDPSATDAPESIGNEDNFFVDPCSVYTEAAEGLSGMVDLYASDKFGDEMVNTNHSIVSFTRPTLAKTPKIKNELKNAHGLKNVFM